MPTIQVDIVSAEGEIYSGEASMVFAPASMGEVGIAPRHAPLLTALKPGEVRVIDPEGKEHFFYITGGMLEVQPHLVTVLADTALRGEQLDEAAALQAQAEAEEALQGASRNRPGPRATGTRRSPRPLPGRPETQRQIEPKTGSKNRVKNRVKKTGSEPNNKSAEQETGSEPVIGL